VVRIIILTSSTVVLVMLKIAPDGATRHSNFGDPGCEHLWAKWLLNPSNARSELC
jgi:hypothetical protein